MNRAPTLEQQRAQHAWQCAQKRSGKYADLSKGVPALIMNSGLMQVLAFLQEKGSSRSQVHCRELGDDLREWLAGRFGLQANFGEFMAALMREEPRRFQQITIEAFAWLRWVRQLAPALRGEEVT